MDAQEVDDSVRTSLRDLVLRLSPYGQNMERFLFLGEARDIDPPFVLSRLEKCNLPGGMLVGRKVKTAVEIDEDETIYVDVPDYHLFWEDGEYCVEIRPEENAFQVIVWRENDAIRNSGYVTSFEQVVSLCENLEKGDFLAAMRILFATYGEKIRTSAELETVARNSITQNTISGVEL